MNSQKHRLIRRYLWDFWQFEGFRFPQEEVINSIVAGDDVLVLMPTGGGKSLCFQLPALVNSGLTIVVSPLVALMENQVGDLQKRGIAARLLHSEIAKEKRQKVLDEIARHDLKLLYLSPETLLTPPIWDRLAASDVVVSSLVIDEAHCLVEWGETFRPNYCRLSAVRESLLRVKPQGTQINIAAFTATANDRVRKTIIRGLQLNNPRIFSTSPYRHNINLQVKTIWTPKQRRDKLLNFIQSKAKQSGIIYVRSRQNAESLSQDLNSLRYANAAYHAGLYPELRRKIETDWIDNKIQFVVSTSAFGMGINKADVRWVLHYHAPQLLSEYVQEIGRSGRDNFPAEAVTFVSECTGLFNPDDKQRQRFFQDRLEKQYQQVQQAFYKLPLQGNVNNLKYGLSNIESILGVLHNANRLVWQDIYNYSRSSYISAIDLHRLKDMQRQSVRQMNEYLVTKECRWKFILNKLGFTEIENNFCCGNCDVCQRKKLGL
jgi:ATP-dependent DNA helicase RecQ